mmetsp:Transcript_14247/g.24234  ORF Transcript_14247/g.24234 Transcript_14247/m.24234 type:complete len:213 (-) Transcript_14247:1458-2096(-)
MSETLIVTGLFVMQLRDLEGKFNPQFSSVAKTLYAEIFQKLQKQDIDQEVKQNSIIAMAQIVSTAHQCFSQAEVDQIVSIFGDRLINELTREASLKGLIMLAQNEHQVIQIMGLGNLTSRLTDLLHKAETQLHISTLKTILALVSRYPAQFKQHAPLLQSEMLRFVNPQYINASSLAVKCAQQLIKIDSKMQQNKQVLAECVKLAGSPLIQG